MLLDARFLVLGLAMYLQGTEMRVRGRRMEMRRVAPVLTAVALVGILASLVSGCSPASPGIVPEAGPPGGGKIVFEAYTEDASDIYIMNADGTGKSLLVSDAARDVTPALSPDGTRLAFASDRDGDPEIYVMNVDGSGLVALTDNEAADLMPAWSPDGEQIAFVSDRVYKVPLQGGSLSVESGMELYIMRAEGSDVERLTGNQEDISLYPSWSPDGASIVYMNLTGVGSIHMIEVASPENPVNLTPEIGVSAWSPKWSPDGRYITFMGSSSEKKDVYRMDADGANLVNLTADWPAYSVDPTWSPDGAQIAFASDKEGPVNLYVMSLEGDDIRALTSGDEDFARPTWSK